MQIDQVVCWAGPIGLAQTWPSRIGQVGSGEPNPDPAPQFLDDLLLSRPSRSCPGDHCSAAPPLTPTRLWSSSPPVWWGYGPPRRALPLCPNRFDFRCLSRSPRPRNPSGHRRVYRHLLLLRPSPVSSTDAAPWRGFTTDLPAISRYLGAASFPARVPHGHPSPRMARSPACFRRRRGQAAVMTVNWWCGGYFVPDAGWTVP
jgi:hypothetical protein